MSQFSHRGVIYLLLLPLLYFGTYSNLTAQLDETCSITVNGGISIESSPRPARISFSVPYLDHSPWSGIENVYLPDSKFAVTSISPNQKSEMLIVNNFDFSIAEASIITGVEVRFIGEKTGLDTVKDKRIQLINNMGAMVGQNKSNKAIYGNEWNQDSLTNKGNWIYGSNQDTWEANLTPQIINSPSFGIAIQVQNIGSEEAKMMLDQVMIRIYYIPAIDICQEHACMSIYTVPENDVVNYDWSVSSGLVHQDSTNAPYLINIYADQSPFGSYEVCLTKTYRNGQQSNCCRNIIYRPCQSGSIGDFVWKDINGNGNQDSGEPGLDDIRVFLYNESEQYLEESITQNGGQYRFENVEPGNYFVHISNYYYCPTIGVGNSDNTDSDFLQAISPLMSKLVTVSPSQNVRNIDFGLINKGTISGLAWVDIDGSATINTNDVFAEGIEVQLQYASGDLIKSTVTRTDGTYVFEDVPPGDYIVFFDFDSEYTNTQSGESLIDTEFKTPVVMLENGGDLMNVNAGVYRFSTIGNLVWYDENENGVYDSNETGLENIIVSLQNCLGEELGTASTDTNGVYIFQQVPPGEYIVCTESNRPDLRPLETASVNITGNTVCSNCLTVIENSIVENVDFAMINAFVQIDISVWFDNDSDGVIGANEQFVNGAEVSVLDCSNNIIQSGISNADGTVRFENLLTGDYYVSLVAPNGEEFSLASSISNANGSGTTDCINIVPVGITLELGLVQLSSVGDYVWEDLNRNGVQDQDEPGIENVTVSLMDCNGLLIADTITSVTGAYSFIDIAPGDYVICTGYDNEDYTTTISDAGTAADDSDFDTATASSCSACFTLEPNFYLTDIDFGYVRKQSEVTVNIWQDLNYNATNDSENAMSSVSVSIYNCSGQLLRSTNTDAAGVAEFNALFLEEFYIEITLENGLTIHPDGNFSGANGLNTTDCFLLEEAGLSVEVPVVELANIGNFVWQDQNGDGIQDAGEPGITNLIVSLQDCNGVLVNQTTTNNDGEYVFEDVLPGDYVICLDDPGDFFEPTVATNNDENNSDFDLSGRALCSSCFTVNTFEDNLDIDFGFIRDISEVSVMLWFDDNGNGVFDSNEDLATNVEVILFDCAGIEYATALSDGNGMINFLDVGLGDYYIQVAELSGFDYSDLTLVTGNNGPGTSDCFTVSLSGAEFEVGFVSNISEVIVELWFDDNGDGRFDSNEEAATDVEVALLDCAGNEIAVATSNENGIISFFDIELGDYYIQVTELVGFDYSSLTSITGDNGAGTSDCFTLDLSSSELEVGFIGPASIGDFVWLDINDNGRQDDNEPGVEGISLNLLNTFGVIQQTVFSDADGQYLFEDLDPGLYRIILVGLDPIYTLSRSGQANEDIDSDFEMFNTLISSSILTLSSNESNLDIDLGLVPAPIQIDGIVWRDSNGNMLNDGEEGQENILVNLYDCTGNLLIEQLTDAFGNFIFENITVGDYYVGASDNSQFLFTAGGDSDITNSNGERTTDCISLDGNNTISMMIGATPVSSMRTQVFVDENENGILESTDSDLQNVGVVLRDMADNEMELKSTDAQGQVYFDNIYPGQYRLELVDLETGLAPTLDGASSEELDSDLLLQGGRFLTDTITMFDGIYKDDIDLGLVWLTAGKISGDIFRDKDGDLNSNGDLGIEAVFVNLYSCDNVLYETTETNDKGHFQFKDIEKGEYYIQVTSVDGFILESGNNSDFTSLNSEGETTCFMVDLLSQINFEAAMIPLGSLGDFLWLDENGNGQQDTNESGVANIELLLLNESDEILNSTSTDDDGLYSFEDLIPGFYKIELIGFEDIYNATLKEMGSSDVDSDLDNGNGRLITDALYLFDGTNDRTYDLGLTRIQTIIGGIVFNDINQNGVRDSGEPGIEDVEVLLLDDAGNEVLVTSPNGDGSYNFVGIQAGDYYVKFEKSEFLTFSPLHIGSDELKDSDVINAEGETELISINIGDVIEGINAGYYDKDIETQQLSIDGFVWEDENGDGVLDLTNESGLNGINVNLYSSDDVLLASIGTIDRGDGRQGYYQFDNLSAGDYYVSFDLLAESNITDAFVGSSTEFDSDIASDYRTNIISLTTSSFADVNAGFYFGSSIGDYVWMDMNDNGFQDIDEVGANGFVINLIDNNENLVATTQSDAGINGQGYYQFDNVAPGNYYLRIDLEAGIVFSQSLMGGINFDSDITNENGPGTTYKFDVRSGQSIQNIDLGLVPQPAQLGDRVWEDYNANGVQDANEPGVNDVIVKLYQSDGSLVDETVTATVNFSAGNYRFISVPPGQYYIAFEFDEDFIISPLKNASDNSTDSDIDKALGEGRTSTFDLSPGEINLDIDGGIYVPSQIGDFVWIDTNLNGQQDIGEVGEEGLEVRLYNNNDEIIATTFTDSLGEYLFDEIVEGQYYLEFLLSSNQFFTDKEKGTDTNIDSNVDESGYTETFDLASRQVRRDFDAGIISPINIIGGETFLDNNADGIKDMNDEAIGGVTVWLLNATATLVLDETVSDANGNYSFFDIEDGAYVIQFIPLAGRAFTGQDFGNDDKVDSDCNASGYTSKMILTGGSTIDKYVSAGYVDITKKSLTNIFPNPVSGEFFKLEVKNVFDNVPVLYTIYNSQGNVIRKTKVSRSLRAGEYTYEVPLEGMDEGMYLIKIKIRNVTEHHKLMVFK